MWWKQSTWKAGGLCHGFSQNGKLYFHFPRRNVSRSDLTLVVLRLFFYWNGHFSSGLSLVGTTNLRSPEGMGQHLLELHPCRAQK